MELFSENPHTSFSPVSGKLSEVATICDFCFFLDVNKLIVVCVCVILLFIFRLLLKFKNWLIGMVIPLVLYKWLVKPYKMDKVLLTIKRFLNWLEIV